MFLMFKNRCTKAATGETRWILEKQQPFQSRLWLLTLFSTLMAL
jgi:hypothetical protein